jgi:FAD-dependent urate hydroxylase
MDYNVVIIGAGPYGLGAGAHLRRIQGLGVKVFGQPMSFWKNQMPVGMLLRSSWEASNLWDPKREFTLRAYQKAVGSRVASPVPLESFVRYGLWFQRQLLPDLDQRQISSIERDSTGFRVSVADGELITSQRVVIASGIAPFAWRPPEFQNLSYAEVSHSSQHHDLGQFRGKRVIVVGGGQSALESGALLHENGADVEIIVRSMSVKWLGWKKKIQSLGPVAKLFYSWTDVGPAGISQIVSRPALLKKFPRETQDRLRVRSIRPAGASWLVARLASVPIMTGRSIVSAAAEGSEIRLKLDDGGERAADHVLLGTGYRVNIARYGFLTPNLLATLRLSGGFPQLGPGFESSIPGLHFLGAPASWSYGPLMNFVSGTKYAGTHLTNHIMRNRGSN